MNVESVGHIYQQLSKNNLYLLDDVYHQDVVFEDSAHRLQGWQALQSYFDSYIQMSGDVTLTSKSTSNRATVGS